MLYNNKEISFLILKKEGIYWTRLLSIAPSIQFRPMRFSLSPEQMNYFAKFGGDNPLIIDIISTKFDEEIQIGSRCNKNLIYMFIFDH